MNSQSISVTLEVPKPPGEVYRQLLDVVKWWGYEDLTGSSAKLNDEFVIDHPGQHYSRQQVIELVPQKKVVWWIKESQLHWLKNPAEWTNTLLVFEITANGGGSTLHFTHEGLVPALECYPRITEGWNMIIKERLGKVLESSRASGS